MFLVQRSMRPAGQPPFGGPGEFDSGACWWSAAVKLVQLVRQARRTVDWFIVLSGSIAPRWRFPRTEAAIAIRMLRVIGASAVGRRGEQQARRRIGRREPDTCVSAARQARIHLTQLGNSAGGHLNVVRQAM